MEDTRRYFDEAYDKAELESLLPPEATIEEVAEEPVTLEEESYLTSGHKTRTVRIGHHSIILRTLKVGEEFEVAIVSDKYKDTIEGNRSYMTAAVAASVQSIDGMPLITQALGPQDESIEAKFNFVQENFYWPVIESLYEEYAELMREQQKVINTLKKG